MGLFNFKNKPWSHYSCSTTFMLPVLLAVLVDPVKATKYLGVQNVAVGKPAVQSSTYNNDGIASHAVDGNTNQVWIQRSCTGTLEEPDSYWAVDLQDTYRIFSVKIYNRLDCCSERLKDIRLWIGNTASDVEEVGYHAGEVGATYEFVFSKPVFGGYLKITKAVTGSLHLCEVEVYGHLLKYTGLYMRNEDSAGTGSVQNSLAVDSATECASICSQHGGCLGFNIRNDGSDLICDIMLSVG